MALLRRTGDIQRAVPTDRNQSRPVVADKRTTAASCEALGKSPLPAPIPFTVPTFMPASLDIAHKVRLR